jgi:hypothetical protein
MARRADFPREGSEDGVDTVLDSLQTALEARDFTGRFEIAGMRKAGAVELHEEFLARELAEAAKRAVEIEAEHVADRRTAHAFEGIPGAHGKTEVLQGNVIGDWGQGLGGSWFHGSPSEVGERQGFPEGVDMSARTTD